MFFPPACNCRPGPLAVTDSTGRPARFAAGRLGPAMGTKLKMGGFDRPSCRLLSGHEYLTAGLVHCEF